MLVSPAEPAQLREGRKVSTLCEQRGADFLFIAHGQWVGIQRKEVQDFLASAADGRLAKEIAQLQECQYRVLIIEGRVQWTLDDEMMTKGYGRAWTKNQWRGFIWSIQNRGIWIHYTDDIGDTDSTLCAMEGWFTKDKHTALDRRPGPMSLWGHPSNEDYQRHLVMGLPGVGPELADRIVKHFDGVPFGWRITEDELTQVKGVGKKKAEQIYKCIQAIKTEEWTGWIGDKGATSE